MWNKIKRFLFGKREIQLSNVQFVAPNGRIYDWYPDRDVWVDAETGDTLKWDPHRDTWIDFETGETLKWDSDRNTWSRC